MTILTLPALPAFQTATFGLRSVTQLFTSPLSGGSQTQELPGAVWTLDAALPPIQDPAQRAAWRVFLVSLRGQAGRFYAGDPTGAVARGVATGTPLVAGAGQTGNSLATDGWTAGIAGILLAGDYIAFAGGGGRRELHLVTADAASDGSGNATLSIEPPIRSAPADNATLIVSSPTCIMMLKDPAVTWSEAEAAVHGFALSAVEALYG
jgi:hypothetical protein